MSKANLKKEKTMSSGKTTSPAVHPNTVVVQLEPQKKAQLDALANKTGLLVAELVLQAIDKFLADEAPASPKKPTRSLRGILAKYGPAPSAEDIKKNRAEMFSNFPRADSE